MAGGSIGLYQYTTIMSPGQKLPTQSRATPFRILRFLVNAPAPYRIPYIPLDRLYKDPLW